MSAYGGDVTVAVKGLSRRAHRTRRVGQEGSSLSGITVMQRQDLVRYVARH